MRCTLMNIAAFLAMTLFMASCFADDAPDLTEAAPTVEAEQTADAETPVPAEDPTPAEDTDAEDNVPEIVEEESVESEAFPVPKDGTPTEYLAFIEKLMLVERPHDQSREEMIAHFTKLCKAQVAAADKVIEHKDATAEQIQRAVAVKIKSLQILIKAGDKDAKIQLYSMPGQLEKAGQSQIADEIVMGLITLTFQDAKKTNDYSEVEKIIEQTDQTIKKTPAEDKEKLQRLYLIKLICVKGLGQLKGVDNSADFEAVIAEIKEAGLSDMVEDIFMGKLANSLSESVSRNDKEMFDKTAKAVDNMIADYGDKANLKTAAIAFQTAFTEEVFDTDAAAARYEKYAAAFEKIQDAKVQEIVKTMRGSAKRLTLKGKELPLTGKTIDGKDFNMADLKDKIVLVYFWSPSVPPCLDEFKYLKLAYPSYKEKGFEIVCIALDQDKKQVAEFVKKNKFPWINMWEKDALIGDVCISEYYGIIALPCMAFVGKDGKVFSTETRNDFLVETLKEEFGDLTVTEEDVDNGDEIDVEDEENVDVENDAVPEDVDVKEDAAVEDNADAADDVDVEDDINVEDDAAVENDAAVEDVDVTDDADVKKDANAADDADVKELENFEIGDDVDIKDDDVDF